MHYVYIYNKYIYLYIQIIYIYILKTCPLYYKVLEISNNISIANMLFVWSWNLCSSLHCSCRFFIWITRSLEKYILKNVLSVLSCLMHKVLRKIWLFLWFTFTWWELLRCQLYLRKILSTWPFFFMMWYLHSSVCFSSCKLCGSDSHLGLLLDFSVLV